MDKTNSAQMAKLAIKALEDKKAEDVRVIDISEISVLADYFIIANGLNVSQVQAMSDNVQEVLGRAGYDLKQVEGYQSANWILLDYGDIIVHIFDKENRRFYDLERIWMDGKLTSAEDLKAEYQFRYDVIKEYAPAQMSAEEVKAYIQEKFAEVVATKNKGMIMKNVMADMKGKADGKVINQVVAELCK